MAFWCGMRANLEKNQSHSRVENHWFNLIHHIPLENVVTSFPLQPFIFKLSQGIILRYIHIQMHMCWMWSFLSSQFTQELLWDEESESG